jgi:hypothetical protein
VSAEEASESGRERWLPVLPAVALVVVAVVQIGLTRAAGLSPWKGGGFGMFSTLDARPYRHLRILVEGPGRSEQLGVPSWAQTQAANVETLPTEAQFERLAGVVVEHERARGRPLESVRLELWRDEHDPVTLRAVSRRIHEHVWRAPR